MSHTVDLLIDGVVYDDKTLEGVYIVWGSQSVQNQPEPTSCSLTLLRDSTLGTVNAYDIKIGATVELTVTPTGQSPLRRFRGIVTDVEINYETVRVDCVAAGIYSIRQLRYSVPAGFAVLVEQDTYITLAVFYVAALQQLGALEPDDTDVLNAPDTFPLIYADGGYPATYPTVSIYEELVEGQPPIVIDVQSIARDCTEAMPLGLLWEDMLKQPGTDRMNVVLSSYYFFDQSIATPDVTLSGDEIEWQWSATRDLGLFANSVSVGYTGTLDVTPGSPTVLEYPNADSVFYNNDAATRGAFAQVRDTRLTTETAAAELARNIADIGQNPGWVADVTIPLATLPESRQYDLINDYLFPGTLYELPTLATGLPTKWWPIGYTETISRNDWQLALKLADVSILWWGQRWQDVTATLQWGQVGATVTWQDLQGTEL
jgi:hypothetical protein